MATSDNKMINIQIAYALPQQQHVLKLQVAVNTTAEQALQQSGWLDKFPELNLSENKLGIFGKVVPNKTVLRDGDRLEIYRPLLADPKEVRKRRAAEAAKKKAADTDAGS